MRTPPTSFEKMRANAAKRRAKSEVNKAHFGLVERQERELNQLAFNLGMVIPRPKRWLADGLETWPGFPSAPAPWMERK